MLGIARRALETATRERDRVVIFDTAGRLQIDEEMMDELKRLKEALKPHEILFVADGMTGQEAVKIAQGFNEALDVSGVVLTKMDGDARGGAALSIFGVTGKPIKFLGVGEKLDGLEEFHPERMAGRILQQGDVLALVEKAQAQLRRRRGGEAGAQDDGRAGASTWTTSWSPCASSRTWVRWRTSSSSSPASTARC